MTEYKYFIPLKPGRDIVQVSSVFLSIINASVFLVFPFNFQVDFFKIC